MSRTYSAEGVVLKRVNFAEADRLVTIFTKDKGKITAIAKGARKPTTKKKASIEPATLAKFFFAKGKNLDILTQSRIIQSYTGARQNLTSMTQTYQILEITDALTPDEQPNLELFQLVIDSLNLLENNGTKKHYLLRNIRQMLVTLGYTHDKQFTETSLKDYIEELADKRLKSKDFLTVTRKTPRI